MLLGLISELNLNNEHKFTVSSLTNPKFDRTIFSNMPIVKSLGHIENIFSKIIVIISYCLLRLNFIKLSKKILVLFDNDKKESFRKIDQCDFLITTGGPFFQETTKKVFFEILTFNYLRIFYELLYAKKIGIEYVIIGQSYGSLKFRFSRKEFKYIVDNALRIYSREMVSANKLEKSTRFNKKIKTIPDLALSKYINQINGNISKNKVILINVRNLSKKSLRYLFNDYVMSINDLERKYIDVIIDLIYILKTIKPSSSIEFLNQAANDDFYFAEKIIQVFKKKNGFRLLNSDSILNINDYLDKIQNAELIITTRYHSLISSFASKTLFLSLSYDEKVNAALDYYDLKNYWVNTIKYDKKVVKKQIENILNNHSYHLNEISLKLERAQEVLTDEIKLVNKLIKKK